MSEIPPGPDWTEKLEPRSVEGLEEEAVLLFEKSPPGMDAGSLTGSDPPPSLSDQHSAKTEISEEMRYKNAANIMKKRTGQH